MDGQAEFFAVGGVDAEIDATGGGALDEGQRAVGVKRTVGAAVRAGPLAGGRVEVRGDFLPGVAEEIVDERLRGGRADVGLEAREFEEGDDRVGGAVVFFEGAIVASVGVKAREALEPVGARLVVRQEFAGDERDVGAHDRDIGVAGTDVAFFDGGASAEDRGVDGGGEVGGEAGAVVAGDLEERDAVEVGPVKIGRAHFRERLFEKPRPDAVRFADGIGVLERDHAAENGAGAVEMRGFAGVEEADGVGKRIAGGVHEATFERGVVAG